MKWRALGMITISLFGLGDDEISHGISIHNFINEIEDYLRKIDPFRLIFFSRAIKCQIFQFFTWYHFQRNGMF